MTKISKEQLEGAVSSLRMVSSDYIWRENDKVVHKKLSGI